MSESAVLTNGTDFAALDKLNRDLKAAARTIGKAQSRYLVDIYYQIQQFRMSAGAQARMNAEGGEPNRILVWSHEQMELLERNIKSALNEFASTYTVGNWLMSLYGIGPVISAGLLAHIDIRKAPTAGHIWRFAGLDPTVTWGKGQKRPWNAKLKTLCSFKAGESFVMVQNREDDVYGKLFRAKKDELTARNERGEFKDKAAEELAKRKWGADTQARVHLEGGKLRPAHIHDMARRYAVKIFLSHLQHVMYVDYFEKEPPVPYILDKYPERGDHRHLIPVPNFPIPEECQGKSLKEMSE